MEAKLSRKSVAVTFAGDDDVIHHITPLSERRASLRPRHKATPKKKLIDPVADGEESESEDDENDAPDAALKPSAALAGDTDLLGTDVFGFKSNKRTGQMTLKATESAQSVTTKPQTPKSALKKSNQSENERTPRRGKRIAKKVEATTPFRLRARNRTDVDEASSDESISSEDDTEDEDNQAPVTPKRSKSVSGILTGTPRTPGGRKRRKIPEDERIEPEAVEAYFEAQQDGTGQTSDRTLARLETPRMDQDTLAEVLKDMEVGYQTERLALYLDHQAHFKRWMFLLCNGYNLLFHGLGSKRRLIDDFRTQILSDFSHLVVHGYFPSLTIKTILNGITEDILEHDGTFRNPIDQCNFIKKHYECGVFEDLYLLIHNIDGAMLRSEKAQTVLSTLAQIRGLHIIASIDHINAPLIWDQTKASRFNWLWYDVTTYDPYVEETSYENSLLVRQSGVLALSSLTHVMRSLTPNARGIFLLLVRHQIDNKDNPNYLGLAFPDLYQRCREAFLVNSDLTLRTQLTEYRDHKLIRTKKGLDGVEYLVIPLDPATLNEFLEEQEQS